MRNDPFASVCGNYLQDKIEIVGKVIKADISDNNCKRELGLSGRKSLKDGTGMLFIFEKEANYGFWMKQMSFPIDILWLDKYFTVVGIEKNLSANTYPTVFGQEYLAKYVLELSAGFSDRNNVAVGNKISILEK